MPPFNSLGPLLHAVTAAIKKPVANKHQLAFVGAATLK